MLIRYTGPKRPKIVNVAGKDFFFNPTMEFNEIFDLPIIEWLLHKDRQGLFIVEEIKNGTPSALHPEITNKENIVKSNNKKQGRPTKRRKVNALNCGHIDRSK